MNKGNSLTNRLVALMLSIVMVLGMVPANVFAQESTAVAQIGDVTYDKLADALAAVPTGTNQVAPAEATTVKLLRDTAYAFDVGISTGATTMNLKLDLNGKSLTLAPSVGSVGTKANGIRVLAYSKLEIANGTIQCSSETADNVKVGIANYGTLILDSVSVQAGSLTQYTVNNRGALTLKGNTAITSGSICAVTNDPYNLYYTSAVNASVTCESADVAVESMLVERYERNSANNGVVELNISAGYFGKIVEDGHSAVGASYDVTGGVIGVSSTEELDFVLNMINAGAEYSAPEKPVTIKMLGSFAGSFDVGISNGKAPKNICLDLNGNTLTLKPGVGSFNTATNGIRVLAYSKLEVKNGTLLCSDEAADKVKVGIANYGELTLDGVALKAGAQTIYTVNNRGALTLKGNTSVTAGSTTAITNDPYNLYYTTDVDASVTCDSSSVSVESILVERYERNSANKGGVKLNISAGSFGKIEEDGASAVAAAYTITGGSFGSDVSDFCSGEYKVVQDENGNFVVKSQQANFGFEKDEYKVTFGENGNKFTAVAQNATGEVTYSFATETDVAEINAETGELTIKKAGTVQVKAVAAGNAQYIEAEDTYTLVIAPAYAQVSSFSGGTVTGSGAADTVVSIDNAVLEWVAKDASIGRTQDGWWVGIKIVAPEGVDLSKAVYQRRSGGSYDGAEVKPFVPESDRYLGMWGLITAEYLESFSNSGKKLNYVWRFSWDGDDVYEQTIAITIDPNGIILKQSGFAFGIDEETITFGEDYTARTPSGGQANKVTYQIENVSASDTPIAQIDPETGKVTAKKAGTVKITATLSGDYYESVSDSYELTIQKADQTGFAFENAPAALTWQATALDALALMNGKGNGAVTWTITEGTDVATVSADGKITLLKAGAFTIQAQKAGDDCYNASAIITATIPVNKAAQSGFGFGETDTATVTYNENNNQYTLAAIGGQSTGGVTYAVVEGEAATVHETSGVVTIKKAGTVTIQATRAADDKYNAATDSFVLTIQKAEQSFTFGHAEAIAETYGLTAFETKINPCALNSGKVTYAVSPNAIGAAVDANGLVTFANSTGKVGTATVTVTMVEDDCYKAFTHTYTITLDYEAVPGTAYGLDGDKILAGSGWFTSDVMIKAPTGYQISYSNDLTGNQWEDHVLWTADGQAGAWAVAPVVYLKKVGGGITDGISVSDLKKDTVKPNGLEISYDVSLWAKIGEMFGFNATTVEVTVSAADSMSGIGKMEYSLDQGQNYTEITPVGGKYTFSVEPQYRGQLYLRATDIAGNAEVYAHKGDDGSEKILVVDHTAPGLTVGYAGGMDDTATEGVRFVRSDKITAVFTFTDENFDLRDADPVVKVNGQPVSGWVCDATSGTLTFDLTEEGDYAIEASFADRLGRTKTYAAEIRIDRSKPEIRSTIENGKYYAENQSIVLTVSEHNFDAAKVNLAVNAVDSQGNAVLSADQIQKFADDAKNPANWVSHGDEHKLTLEITEDGNYTLTVNATDVLGWTSDNYSTSFTVDKLAPVDLQISYSEPVNTLWDDILHTITFGAYNPNANKPLTVTLTASDAVAGVEYFEWFYTREAGASQANAASGSATNANKLYVTQRQENSDVSSVSFEVAPEARGYISFRATDRSGNTYGKDKSGATTEQWVVDSGRINIVDTIAPKREVSFTPTNVVDIATMKDTAQWNENSAVVLYYNTDAVATFKITETNFYAEDVKVFVNGEEVALDQTNWTVGAADNVWTNTLTIVEEGDYVISMTYTDRSTNKMVAYESQRIVIDKTNPVIRVDYANTDVKNTIGGRKYFSKAQSATITIKEHNFRAEDVVIKVTAKDVLGNAVLALNNDGTVKAYADQGANKAYWTPFENGTWRVADDAYILNLNFTADANYTFDIEYQDLAKNAAADYQQDLFTVDTTAPKNLTVDYSTSVLEQIKESITFGYYNAMMTVTITAEDDTSGIYHFAYSYIKGKEVSGVNAELLEQAIREAEVTYDGKKATATFNIPKMVLGADNQFNGTVEFTAFDRSEVSTELKDTTVIVVDNITPTSQITYNAPVQTADNISYYGGNINATIAINEANFDAGDVVVTVTKDGQNFPVNVTWTDESVDSHTGTFTLTSDGDYLVGVQYKDKSGNTMAAYQSNQLTLDATKPTIQVSNIQANSANKDETYGFVITVNDTNLDASSLKPVLQAVIQKEEGVYLTQEIDLGTARTVVAGQTYTYTVENLPQDGLYTLTCNVKDMSGNAMSQLVLADGKSYEQVQFSINRNGSTFGYGNKFTDDLVGQYYIYSVDEDIVIVEVNVDPIEQYTVSLNGKQLVEGTDYTTIQTSKADQWSKRTYTLKKDLFAEEGEYSIIVSSVDKTETTAFSDVKNLSLAFVVDQTAPVLTITGLEAGGRYQTDAQTVTLIPTDEGGRLNSLSVLVLDSSGDPLVNENGEDISVRFNMAGEELLKYLEDNDGKITFTIPEGLNNQVKIICNDCAINAQDLTNEYNELFQRVTVSQNQLVIFYANTPLFVGSIVGVLAVAGLIIFLIKRKGSKKDKTAAKA